METIHVKNMVCDRCISTVHEIFVANGVKPQKVKLGQVSLAQNMNESQRESINSALLAQGFEFIDSSIPILVSNIKSALIAMFNKPKIPEDFKLSSFLSERFPYDYSHQSRVFSQHQKDTIEHYVIKLRIEKAKELLTYNDLNISEVAYTLGYASNAHFSRQFKKLVGISPSKFQENPTGRKSLEDI